MSIKNIRAHVFVAGRVQGVFYRDSTREQARSLGLRGWVRNLYDGRVEAVIEGEEARVERLLAYMHGGPEFALVENMQIERKPYKGEFEEFSIEYTA